MSAEEALRAAMRQNGIEYDGQIDIDGRLHRIKAAGDHSKNSWYMLHPGSPVVGAFGCWKRDVSINNWCERNSESLTKEEQKTVRKRQQQASSKRKTETLKLQAKARKTAAWILSHSAPALSLHGYLSRKRVKAFGALRVRRRRLVVPLRDATGALHSLQFIDNDGGKQFLSGGRVAGCFFTLSDNTDKRLVICEGYTTGASIHEATDHAVICAMNSGNLVEVAKAARELWARREIIIAADNDQFTDGNPGLTKATAVAKAIKAKLAVPHFDDVANKPTDFNDLATAQGLDAVRQQIDSALRVIGKSEAEKSTDVDLPAAFFDTGRNAYWILNQRRSWIALNETQFKRILKQRGVSPTVPKDSYVSPLDEQLIEIRNVRRAICGRTGWLRRWCLRRWRAANFGYRIATIHRAETRRMANVAHFHCRAATTKV